MPYKVLVINPGSTSTKIALFEGQERVFQETLRHTEEELAPFAQVMDQMDFRRGTVEKALRDHQVDPATLDAVCARGGQVPACPSGAFAIFCCNSS